MLYPILKVSQPIVDGALADFSPALGVALDGALGLSGLRGS
jgi:hypothetical protein